MKKHFWKIYKKCAYYTYTGYFEETLTTGLQIFYEHMIFLTKKYPFLNLKLTKFNILSREEIFVKGS